MKWKPCANKHDGWQGYGHWQGTGTVGVKKDQQFLPFKKALLCARSLKLKGVKEWRRHAASRHALQPKRHLQARRLA